MASLGVGGGGCGGGDGGGDSGGDGGSDGDGDDNVEKESCHLQTAKVASQ